MEPTAEQMSYLMQLLKERSVPWCDFALWGPHQGRTMCKLMGTVLRFGRGGTWQRQQFNGPPSFELWKKCWEVYEVAIIYADAASPWCSERTTRSSKAWPSNLARLAGVSFTRPRIASDESRWNIFDDLRAKRHWTPKAPWQPSSTKIVRGTASSRSWSTSSIGGAPM